MRPLSSTRRVARVASEQLIASVNDAGRSQRSGLTASRAGLALRLPLFGQTVDAKL